MSLDIQQFRQKYPQYAALNDEELARRLHAKYYSQMDPTAFRSKFFGRAPVDPSTVRAAESAVEDNAELSPIKDTPNAVPKLGMVAPNGLGSATNEELDAEQQTWQKMGLPERGPRPPGPDSAGYTLDQITNRAVGMTAAAVPQLGEIALRKSRQVLGDVVGLTEEETKGIGPAALLEEGLGKLVSGPKKFEEEALAALRPDVRRSIELQFIEQAENGGYQFAEGATDPWWWTSTLMNTAAMMLPGVAGAGVAARISYASRLKYETQFAEVLAKTGSREAAHTAATAAAAATTSQAAATAAYQARYAQVLTELSSKKIAQSLAVKEAEVQAMAAAKRAAMIAGGAAEGGIAAGINSGQIMEILDQVDEETMMKYEPYRELRQRGFNHEAARSRVALDQGLMVGATTAIVTGALGAPLNSLIGKWAAGGSIAASRAGAAAKLAAFEGGQEFFQEGSEQLIQNIGEMPVTGKNPWDHVLENAVTGLAVGALIGGAGGVVAGQQGPAVTKPEEVSTEMAQKVAYLSVAAENLNAILKAASSPVTKISTKEVQAAREEYQKALTDAAQIVLRSGQLDDKQQKAVAAALQQAQRAGLREEAPEVPGQVRATPEPPAAAPEYPLQDDRGPYRVIKSGGLVHDDRETIEATAGGELRVYPKGKGPTAKPAREAATKAKPEALSEVETARYDALNRVAQADTIELNRVAQGDGALEGLIAEGLARVTPQGQPILLPAGRRQLKELEARAKAVEEAKTVAEKPQPVVKKPQTAEKAPREIAGKTLPAATKPATPSAVPIGPTWKNPLTGKDVEVEVTSRRGEYAYIRVAGTRAAPTEVPTSQLVFPAGELIKAEEPPSGGPPNLAALRRKKLGLPAERRKAAAFKKAELAAERIAKREAKQKAVVAKTGTLELGTEKPATPATTKLGDVIERAQAKNVTERIQALPATRQEKIAARAAQLIAEEPVDVAAATTPSQRTLRIEKIANRKQNGPHRVALVQKNDRFYVYVEKENYDSGRYLKHWLLATSDKRMGQQGVATREEAEAVFQKFSSPAAKIPDVAGAAVTRKPAGFEQDNPALSGDEHSVEWLAEKQKNAEEDMATAKKAPLEIGTEMTMPASAILTSQKSFDESAADNVAGKASKTEGPLEVWQLDDGRLLLTDGQHRFAKGVVEGRDQFKVRVVGRGPSDYYATPQPGKEFKGAEEPVDVAGAVAKKKPAPVHAPEALLAPNGKLSKLTRAQWEQVRTPEFVRWFGDWEKFALVQGGVWNDGKKEVSKVVDRETREPLVVYHASVKAGFDAIEPSERALKWAVGSTNGIYASFFSDSLPIAKTYAGRRAEEIDLEEVAAREQGDIDQKPGYYPVFLNIRDPQEENFEGANWDGDRRGQWMVIKYDENGEPGEPGERVYADDGTGFFEDRDEAMMLAMRKGGDVGPAYAHEQSTNGVVAEAARYKNDGAIIRNVVDNGGFGEVYEPSDVFVVFNAKDVKSATQNRGAFDPEDPRLAFSVAPAFYSAALRAAEASKLTKATGAQWYGAIRNTPGVRQEELDWIGLKDWLGDRKGVTKEEVTDYLRANELKIEEQELVLSKIEINYDSKYATPAVRDAIGTEFGDALERSPTPRDMQLQLANTESVYRSVMSAFPELREEENWAGTVLADLITIDGRKPTIEDFQTFNEKQEKGAKFSEKQMPGGKNYKTVLLQLPDAEPRATKLTRTKTGIREEGGRYYAYSAAGDLLGMGDTMLEAREAAERAYPEIAPADTYRTPHYPDEANVVAHIRFNERTDTDGRTYIFLETVQSDWHQTGRSDGYRSELPAEGLPPGYKTRKLPNQEVWNIYRAGTNWKSNAPYHSQAEAIEGARSHYRMAAVPDAPFKTTWPELVMKRMIRYAAENGFDGVGWTTGEQQTDRWGSSQGELASGMEGFYDEILPHAVSKIGKKYGAKASVSKAGVDDSGVSFGTIQDDGSGAFNAHGMLLTPDLKAAALGGFPLFMQNQARPAQSISYPELHQVVNRIESELGIRANIAMTQKQLPVYMKNFAKDRQLMGAFAAPGGIPEAWLVAENIPNAAEAYEVAMHEIVGHMGLQALLQGEYGQVMDAIIKSFPAAVMDAARKNDLNIGHPDPATRRRLHRRAAEELVAYSAGELLSKRGTKAQRTLWQRVVDAVKAALRKVGLLSKYSDSDIESLILRSLDYVRRMPSKTVEQAIRYEHLVERAAGAVNPQPVEPPRATLNDFTPATVGDILNKGDWAILTAENPGNRTLSEQQNFRRNDKLRVELGIRGYRIHQALGRYKNVGDPPENSYVVTDISETSAIQLGKRFGQESVLTRRGLVYMDGRPVTPATGVTVHETAPENFYTTIPATGATFTVDLNWDAAGAVKDDLARSIWRVAQHLDAPARAKLHRGTAQKLADLFDTEVIPSRKEMASVAQAGQIKRGWYRDAAEMIANVFGPDGPRFAALLAALSPRISVASNFRHAVAIWIAWDKAGRPTERKAIVAIMARNLWNAKDREGKTVGVLLAWINNTVRTLQSETPGSIVLSGPKVASFAANLRGETDKVTLDSWMAAYAFLDEHGIKLGGSLNKAQTDPGKRPGYLAYEARVRETAKFLTKKTGERWTPSEVQETIWSWTMTLVQEAEKFGPMSSAAEIVQNGELTNDLINAAPDFATLFAQPEHQQILRDAGYGEQLDRAAQQQEARAGTRRQAPAPTAADRKNLLTAANRLDRFIAARRRSKSIEDIDVAGAFISKTGIPDLDSFISKIGGRPRTLKQMWADWTDRLWARGQQGLFDDLHGILRAGDLAGLSAADVGFKNAHVARSAAELTQAIIEYGYPVWHRDGAHEIAGIDASLGGGLLAILKPLGNKLDLWMAWTIAKRADRLAGENRENLFTQPEIAAALALGTQHPEFAVVGKRYDEFHKRVLDFAEEAGIIDPQTRSLWEHADYIPFYRLIENSQIQGPSVGGAMGKVRNQIRRLRGGKANLGDPLENIARNWHSLMDASLKAHAARTVVDALDGSGLVTRAPQFEFTQAIVPLSQVKTFIKNNPILAAHLKAAGLDPAKLPPAAFAGLQKMLAVQAPTGEDIVSVWRNGKREYWHVHDDMLFESMMNIGKAAWGPWMEPFRLAKRVGTFTITSTAAFGIKNFWRDSLHVFIQGAAGRNITITPGLASAKGLVEMIRMDSDAQDMLAGGGTFTHGYIRAGDARGAVRSIRRSLRKISPSEVVLDSIPKVWRFYRDMLNAAENANRIAMYQRMRKAGASRLESVYEARDTLDFAKHGNNVLVQFLTQTVMFMNARAQGLHRLGRGAGGKKAVAGSIAWRGAMYMMAILGLSVRYRDDDRYKALTDAQKATYIHFFDVFSEGDHWQLPVPFEVGTIFGTVPVAIFDALVTNSDEPDRWKQAMKLITHAFAQSLNMSPEIQLIQPLLELAINRNTFTGQPILTMGDEAVLPEDQDSPSISSTYRLASRLAPSWAPEALRSPKQLQHLGRGYLGPLQDYVLVASDVAARKVMGEPPAPARTARDIVDIRSFAQTGPARQTKYGNVMYDIAEEAQRVHASISRNEKAGTEQADERIEELETENAALLDVRKDFVDAVQDTNELRKEMRAIQLDPDLTPQEKREQIDELQIEINDIAKEVFPLRPGGPLNPETAMNLIGKTQDEQVQLLVAAGFPATAYALENLG